MPTSGISQGRLASGHPTDERRRSRSTMRTLNPSLGERRPATRQEIRFRRGAALKTAILAADRGKALITTMDDGPELMAEGPVGTIGEPRLRAEDRRLLRGEARFVEDIALPGELRAVFLRSPHAHARIAAVRIGIAESAPGVRLVATAADVRDLGGVPWEVRPPADAAEDGLPPVGSPDVAAPQPLMAASVARFAGEIVAMVVADGENEARDAAELIDADFEALDACANPPEADAQASLRPQAPGNLAFAIRMGDAEAVEKAFARAAHVVSVDCASNRVAGVPLETRGCIGEPSGDRMILHAPVGKPHGIRKTMAEHVFRVAPERIAVKVPDIGGGFGIKNVLYPEHCLTLWAARRLGRPVKWIGRRDECFLSDVGCREQSGRGELALDRDGNILAVRVRSQGNLGAYLAPRGVVSLRNSGYVASNVYAVPHVDFEMRAFYSNTAPTCNFRGAGEPEGVNIAERLAARAARLLNIDPVAFRRRNLLAASALPRTNPAGLVQDAGDYEAVLDGAMEAADRDGFAARRRRSETNNRLRGWGMAMHLYMSGFNFTETTTLVVLPDGRVDLFIGAQSGGQGHATVFAQIAGSRLGIDPGAIRVVQGDTDLIPAGSGTGASRSLTIGGSSAALAADALVETGRRLAAQALEAAPEDIRYRSGLFSIAGTDRGLDLGCLAERAERNGPDGRFSASASYRPRNGTSAAGCQICEAEVDPETGAINIDRFAIVQDAGRAINPLIVEGQIHGGAATGLGQSLCEHAIYDRGTAQLLTGSFMDYGFPRADQTPSIEVHLQEVPSVANPLGAKGIGEAGGVGAMPAIVEAILDALSPLGVDAIDPPATPQRVWQAIERARQNREKTRV